MPPRARAAIKWTACVVWLTLLVVWAASGWTEVGGMLLDQEWRFGIRFGEARLSRWLPSSDLAYGSSASNRQDAEAAVDTRPQLRWWNRGQWIWSFPRWTYRSSNRHTYFRLTIPVWLPLSALLVPIAWLFYCDRRSVRRAEARQCTWCGYDLRGLRNRCPECGRPARVG